jgi:hypothetical protein
MIFCSPNDFMPSHLLRLILLGLVLLCTGIDSRAGDAAYTDRGTIDFDAALHLLNPYGTWSKIDNVWAYTPLNHEAPYTNGRWLYTEYGWYWKGNNAHIWLTEHYGYWKRSADKVWSWYPGPSWLSEIIEFRETPTHIGWRSAQVDREGNFVEEPDDRYAKTDEWTFVTKAQFANPITPGIVAKPDATAKLLEDSTDSVHAYLTYRPIPRPGPHPADFVALCKDGGMFSPFQTQMVTPPPAPTAPKPITVAATTNAPVANAPATNAAAAKAPSLVGMDDDADHVDTRQVKYWVTMSLPTFWTQPPPDAKLDQLFMFRPDFFQDEDGIQRRVTLWFNPLTKTSLKEVFAETLNRQKSTSDAVASVPAVPAQPATPAVPARPHDAFASPLDSSIPSGHYSASSSKNPSDATNAPAPSGLMNPPSAGTK